MRIDKSTRKGKKYMIQYKGKTIHFGQEGASDYTIHKDPERKKAYINRHKKRENWTKSGANTAGFWSRWILWNEPISPEENMKLVHKKFNL
tara:strand:+ start:480 stop:752 length:273 start_codon:yes stop_codon:yes gene_type:complete